jgi:ribA/ribD-fused uncharacterized protein
MTADRLFFYSNSADRAPGEGANEQVADPKLYAELKGIPNWRKRLSNFWEADFKLDGVTYRTVEHAFQAAKIALVDATKAKLFTLESGSELARGGGLEARKQRKMVMLTPAQLATWNAHKHTHMGAAMRAKFTQHAELGKVLLATGSAELWHGTGRGQPPARILELEAVRAELRAQPAR